MKIIKEIIQGILIGAGAIIPGVSSGVICVSLGIYEKLLNAVLNIFIDFKENFKFLLPIGMGIIIGMNIFGNILKYLFYAYPLQTSFIFIGLIIGSLPGLIKQANKRKKFSIKYISYTIISMLLGLGIVVLEKNILITSYTEFNNLYLFVSGICMSVGIVVPGISSTLILMILGVYKAYLSSLADFYLPILLPIGLGVIVGSLICMKTIKKLLENYYIQTFYSIIGFTIGSIFILYPGISFNIDGIISVVCFFLGYLIANSIKIE